MSKPKTLSKSKKTQDTTAQARQGSVYDKMIKENFEKSLMTIIQDIGGVPIVKSEPLRTKMQHTKERDPDDLSTIVLANGEEKILHAEVHLKDEEDVNFRLCEYYIMIKRKDKKLPIIQFVIYIGNEDPQYITGFFETDVLSFRYNVIILKNIPYQKFLNAKNPETVVFSILANFQGEEPETIGLKIAERLKKLAKTDAAREKYYTQLRVLSNIRKLQPIIDKIMANIFKLIDISQDPLFVEGKQEGKIEGKVEGKVEGKIEGKLEGILEGKLESVKSLVINTDFDDAHIAFLIAVPKEYVTNIRAKFNDAKKEK